MHRKSSLYSGRHSVVLGAVGCGSPRMLVMFARPFLWWFIRLAFLLVRMLGCLGSFHIGADVYITTSVLIFVGFHHIELTKGVPGSLCYSIPLIYTLVFDSSLILWIPSLNARVTLYAIISVVSSFIWNNLVTLWCTDSSNRSITILKKTFVVKRCRAFQRLLWASLFFADEKIPEF